MRTRTCIKVAVCRSNRPSGFALDLECKTPNGRLIYTTFVFDPDGPRSSSRRKKWDLFQKMARAYDVTLPDNLRDVSWLFGKYYLFEFERWGEHFLIRRFRRCDPFEVSEPSLEELIDAIF